ncbi:Uncharacterized protein BM_BM1340 [Brugia malayi]|uniref:Bm1340 n=1 Tax=Brugia malayi TaxID=6279 RepID=A0A0J9XV20_BRUMA|nr:Uncharacterized protein BM_BM1340 [Brugia malayi]CDP96273.1 Bm1340 [Brugia malayi]VIO98459.1 Uncharacterized protein BM_BM1340 [Brugia malayi]
MAKCSWNVLLSIISKVEVWKGNIDQRFEGRTVGEMPIVLNGS